METYDDLELKLLRSPPTPQLKRYHARQKSRHDATWFAIENNSVKLGPRHQIFIEIIKSGLGTSAGVERIIADYAIPAWHFNPGLCIPVYAIAKMGFPTRRLLSRRTCADGKTACDIWNATGGQARRHTKRSNVALQTVARVYMPRISVRVKAQKRKYE